MYYSAVVFIYYVACYYLILTMVIEVVHSVYPRICVYGKSQEGDTTGQ